MSDTIICGRCGDYKCPDPSCKRDPECPECGGFVCRECGVLLTYTVKADPDLRNARLRFEKALSNVTEVRFSSVPDEGGAPQLVINIVTGGIDIATTIWPGDNTEAAV